VACLVTFGGILVSYRFDLPPNQTIGLAHCLVFLLAVLTRTRLPGIGWRSGIPFTGLATAACLFFLLTVPVDGQRFDGAAPAHASSPTVSGKADTVAESQVVGSSDWPALVERIDIDFRTRGRSAVPDAITVLRRDPPLLFRAQIVTGIEKAIAASSGWQIRRPASDPVNQTAAEACLALSASPDGREP
ncbi:hypothetical protein KBA41_06100, partial [Candidatus Ozemobacteraceae bacterium]|nr:hypothetical protein [Candidatus Ozemobacteraceae bacterium]